MLSIGKGIVLVRGLRERASGKWLQYQELGESLRAIALMLFPCTLPYTQNRLSGKGSLTESNRYYPLSFVRSVDRDVRSKVYHPRGKVYARTSHSDPWYQGLSVGHNSKIILHMF